MSMIPLAPDYIRDLSPYVPGKSAPRSIKLASNENPFGPSPRALEQARQALLSSHLYPSNYRYSLKEKIVSLHARFNLKTEQIVIGNGSTELITLLVRTLVGQNEAILNAWPSFLMYRLACRAQGRQEISIPLTESLDYDLETMAAQDYLGHPIKLMFLANPNNPTGRYIKLKALESFLNQIPADTVVVLDEAYIDFVRREDYPNGLTFVQQRPRTVVLRTFSKAYGLAGLRVAYAVCDPEIADLLHKVRDPFNVNSVACAAALGALDDMEHVRRTTESNWSELLLMEKRLTELGIKFTPSAGNFILAHFKNAEFIYEKLMDLGVIVRPVDNYGLQNSLRISIGRPEHNEVLLTGIKRLIN